MADGIYCFDDDDDYDNDDYDDGNVNLECIYDDGGDG